MWPAESLENSMASGAWQSMRSEGWERGREEAGEHYKRKGKASLIRLRPGSPRRPPPPRPALLTTARSSCCSSDQCARMASIQESLPPQRAPCPLPASPRRGLSPHLGLTPSPPPSLAVQGYAPSKAEKDAYQYLFERGALHSRPLRPRAELTRLPLLPPPPRPPSSLDPSRSRHATAGRP